MIDEGGHDQGYTFVLTMEGAENAILGRWEVEVECTGTEKVLDCAPIGITDQITDENWTAYFGK